MSNIGQNFNSTLYTYPQNAGYNVPSKGFDDLKKQDTMAGKVADTIDITERPTSWFKSLIGGILMSMGFVHLANWSMSTKNITDGMSQVDAYQASRLYKFSSRIDKFGPVAWLTKKAGGVKNAISKIPVPQFLKNAWAKVKTGTVSTWDQQGMYTLGKHAEALKESVTFFSEVDDNLLRTLTKNTAVQDELVNLMKNYRANKIDGVAAFRKLDDILKRGNVTAKALDAVSKQRGTASKILGTTQNLNTSLSKARFFAGMNNTSGPVSRAMNKAYSLWTEASGGGVLGGGMLLFMNAAGLMTAFNAAQSADKGDKFKAFMEDYLGFTIGGYVGGMFVGWGFHKFLGLGENAMRLNSPECQEIVKKLGLTEASRVQDVVIAYNKEFKGFNTLQKYLAKAQKGKVVKGESTFLGSIGGWFKRLFTREITEEKFLKTLKGLGIAPADTSLAGLKTAAEGFVNVRKTNYFEPMRKNLIDTMSVFKGPKIKSVFQKGSELTGKNVLTRFGDWFMKKPVAAFARLMGTGKYTLLKNGNFVGNNFRTLKRVGGGIARMWLIGFVLTEPLRKIAMKFSHKTFGKPKKSQLDEENKEKEQKMQQKQQQQQQILNNQNSKQMPKQQSQNLVNIYAQNIPQNNRQVKESPETAQKNQMQKLKADSATYIPNQVLGQESYIDPGITQELLQRRDLALMQADAAERNARDVLSRF